MQTYSTVVGNLEAHGDALAAINGQAFYIPFVLPGEQIEFTLVGRNRGQVSKIINPSPDRVNPLCRHYTKCGGCKFQHFRPAAYLKFKKEILKKTLEQKGINADISDIVAIPAHTRQRVTFASVFSGNSHWFGFNPMKSSVVTPVTECPLLEPKLEILIPKLKKQCASITGSVGVTLAVNGFDILITAKDYPDLAFLQNLSEFAYANDVIRVSWHASEFDIPEKILEITVPQIEIGSRMLPMPSGAFLQASRKSQKALADLVVGMIRKIRLGTNAKIADLFCGLGSLTIPVKDAFPDTEIVGYDNFAPSVNILNQILPATIQDLFKNPLTSTELSKFDVVIMDPPRAGAIEQIKQINISNLTNLIYVSCNPASFVRDAKELYNAGYRIAEIVPVDQFIFSAHIEVVTRFTKDKP